MDDNDTTRASRRRFFRLAIDAMRDGALDAARQVGQAATEFGAAMDADGHEVAPQVPAEAGRRPVRRTGEATTARSLVRPPGALAEAQFVATCVRCHACVAACPEGALLGAPPSAGSQVSGTPYLPMANHGGVMCADVPCASACPSGALRPITVAALRLGTARVSERLCLNPTESTCDVCVSTCPLTGSAIEAGPDGLPRIDDTVCTGCGLCVVSCPAYPRALRVIPA